MLGEILGRFVPPTSDKLLVGIDGVDDAGVYKLTDDMALVLTVDFFPPIVDDAFTFGRVAAANALSDVYAMGGRPVAVLNILAFPAAMPPDIVVQVLRGGAEKIAEAGAVIAGGHSVKDNELKYGLAVTGVIHPDRIVTNGGARPGDRLVLTKPLGTGIISTAVKQNRASAEETARAVESMASLNKTAGEAMVACGAHAATDITGFGLAGHACEMAAGSRVSMEIDFAALPLLPGAVEHARAGALTGGAGDNRAHLEGKVRIAAGLDKTAADIMYDPQTSGGLLVALDEGKIEDYLARLRDDGVSAAVIGRVIEPCETALFIR